MAKSLSTRFGLQRWTADSDTQQRSEFDNDAAQIDTLAAKAGHGTISARPAASAAWADGLWLITDATGGGVVGTLYYCDGTTWTTYAPRKQGLATNRPAASLAQQHYYKTDTDLLSIDDGSAWHDFPSKAVTDAAYVAKPGIATAEVATSETTASASFVDLATAGPSVTATTGASALIVVNANLSHSSSTGQAIVGVAVSGATTRAAADDPGISTDSLPAGAHIQAGSTFLLTGLTPGSNTFTLKYRTNSATATFLRRIITVIPL